MQYATYRLRVVHTACDLNPEASKNEAIGAQYGKHACSIQAIDVAQGKPAQHDNVQARVFEAH